MFELKPARRFSWSFRITRDAAPIGLLELARVRAGGTLTLEDHTYGIAREGLFGPLQLMDGERVIAQAHRKALFRARYQIIAEDRQLELIARGFLGRRAELRHGDVVLARIRRISLLTRDVRIDDGAGNIPLPVLMHCAAVLILYWRMQSRSSR